MTNAPSIKFTKEQSETLNVVKCVAMLGVILIHSDLRHAVDPNALTDVFQQAISLTLASASVPVFFFISGYLLFLNFDYSKKLKSRIRSLLVPYILACIWGLFIIFILQAMLGLEKLFSGNELKLLKDFTVLDYARAFWNVRDGSPIISVLWFLRDLLALVVISPIIYWLLKKAGYWFVGGLFVLNMVHSFALFDVGSWSLFYFSLGGLLMLKAPGTTQYDYLTSNKLPFIVIWGILLVVAIFAYVVKSPAYDFITRLYIIATIPVLIALCSIPKVRTNKILLALFPASFFIYLMHEPWMGYAQKMFYKVFDLPEWTQLIMYWVFPFVTIGGCYMLFILMKKFCPKILSVIIGKR